jgi:predicted aconitase with swiveling domain
MTKTFKGRIIIKPDSDFISGEALVSRVGVNPLASWKDGCLKNQKPTLCSDANNPDLYGKQLDGKIICLPQFIGSTSAGLVLQTAAYMGLGPKALLFSNSIDSLAASGVVLSNIWVNQKIITVDRLGEEFLSFVKDGMKIEIKKDGTIIVD